MILYLTVLTAVSWACVYPMLRSHGRPAVDFHMTAAVVADVPVVTFDHQGLV